MITGSSPVLFRVSGEKLPRIPARYTCDGSNTTLPVRWGKLPAATKEVVLFLVHLGPTGFLYDWAVAGLYPDTHGIAAGKLPAGAVVGRSSTGHAAYSICPPKGKRVAYTAFLFGLPRHVPGKTGFGALTYLENFFGQEAIAEGRLLQFTYKRV